MSCTVASRTASRPPAAAKHRSYPAITAAHTRVSRAGPQLSPLASDQPSFLRHDIPAVRPMSRAFLPPRRYLRPRAVSISAASCRISIARACVTVSTHSSVMPAPATTAGSSAIPASATVGALADPLSTFHGDRKPVVLGQTEGRHIFSAASQSRRRADSLLGWSR